MSAVHPDSVLSAFAEIDGDSFEGFFKEFGAGVFGLNFTPVGGKKDGGADGFSESEIFETNRRLTYFQASIQDNFRDKIRRTVERLREYGREIGNLTYFTSRIIADPDKESLALSDELEVNISIRDGQWIANRINENDITKASYENYLRQFSGLRGDERRNSSIRIPSEFNTNAAVFVAQQSLVGDSKQGIRGLVLDSLVFYVLENAAVDDEGFITSIDIFARMQDVFPDGFRFTDTEVAERLALMSSKEHPLGRQIVWDDREAGYALPFSARSAISTDHARFEALIYTVKEQFRQFIADECRSTPVDEVPISDGTQDRLVGAAMRSLEWLFMAEGIKVAQFLEGEDEDISEDSVSDVAVRAIADAGIGAKSAPLLHRILMSALRSAFYKSTDEQREYLSLLARTYSLLFSLKYDLKIANYFKDMKSNFRLLVGTDVIIQALSESRLAGPSRLTHGMLRALRASGAELILTDQVVEEVYTHIIASNEEYVNHYQEQDKYMTLELARNSDRVLIRSYYYAKFDAATPALSVRTWSQFIEQFLPYEDIRSGEARMALRTYLADKFGMRLETRDEILDAIDIDKHRRLTSKLFGPGKKQKKELAENDAAHVLFIYAMRTEGGEVARASAVGYRTWWLTSETKIQREFEDLTRTNGKVIMRPQIAMQLLSFAPNSDEVEQAFGSIMPSLVGVRLGNRVNPSILRNLLDKVRDISESDPSRMKAEMQRLANKFKSDENASVQYMIETSAT
ncbi:hypothetical protein [Brevundimonas sp. UBA7664]|uniref:hypothetical protein n=1 Tax=Brevundimonas sp. UBA7664 TaxID=1946141 RepID=UPI0025BD738D|nr:hypothetical protein [Brevundimonas sp. UBA7664]